MYFIIFFFFILSSRFLLKEVWSLNPQFLLKPVKKYQIVSKTYLDSSSSILYKSLFSDNVEIGMLN